MARKFKRKKWHVSWHVLTFDRRGYGRKTHRGRELLLARNYNDCCIQIAQKYPGATVQSATPVRRF